MHGFMVRKVLRRLRREGRSLAANKWKSDVETTNNMTSSGEAVPTATNPLIEAGKEAPAEVMRSNGANQLTAESPSKENVEEKLSAVRTEGERELLSWHARVGDVLRIAVDKETELVEKFDKIKIDIENKGDISSNVDDVCDIIDRAVELNRLRPPTASDRQDLKQEVQGILAEKYFTSWWIRVPGIILVVAFAVFVGSAVFALTGAFKILDQEVSIRKLIDQEMKTAHDVIQKEMKAGHDKVTKEIDQALAEEKERIHSETRAHLNEILGEPRLFQLVGGLEWVTLGGSSLAVFLSVCSFFTSRSRGHMRTRSKAASRSGR